MPNDKLFFIAILPPEEIIAEVTAFKEDIRDNYGSSKALKVVPHITLKAPFKIPAEERAKLLYWFKNIPVNELSFSIELKNFGSFDNNHNKVIYVKPCITEPMTALQKSIVESFRQAFPEINMSTYEQDFRPHMTIAYRDLTAENYEKAWAVYKDKQYSASFICRCFCLLQHNGMQWEVIQEHYLEKQ